MYVPLPTSPTSTCPPAMACWSCQFRVKARPQHATTQASTPSPLRVSPTAPRFVRPMFACSLTHSLASLPRYLLSPALTGTPRRLSRSLGRPPMAANEYSYAGAATVHTLTLLASSRTYTCGMGIDCFAPTSFDLRRSQPRLALHIRMPCRTGRHQSPQIEPT